MCDKNHGENRRGSSEDFIGWVSEDGNLKVIGIHEKSKEGKATTFKVTCTECSKDPELFPDGYFVSTKSNLKSGQKPCGCSKKPEWQDWQYLILARRAGEGKFIVHGFAGGFCGKNTKLNLECIKDGYKWQSRINNVINTGNGCPRCKGIKASKRNTIPERVALQKCVDICNEMGYDVIGFVGSYRGAKDTRFEYKCQKHEKQNVSYTNFVNGGHRCKGCWKEKQKELGNGNGYYPERKDEVDFLYILDFNSKFIKVGRSFDIDERIKSLRTASKVSKKKIHKLRIFTATHQEIYDYEQELLRDLRERGFQYYVPWSTECFENDCQFILNKLLDICKLEELIT